MKLSRRVVTGAVAGAPVLLFAASAVSLGTLLGGGEARAAQAEPSASPSPEPEDSALGRFLAKDEKGLTSEERRKVRKQVGQLEQSLAAIRDFQLTNDVPPSGCFRALRTDRRHGR